MISFVARQFQLRLTGLRPFPPSKRCLMDGAYRRFSIPHNDLNLPKVLRMLWSLGFAAADTQRVNHLKMLDVCLWHKEDVPTPMSAFGGIADIGACPENDREDRNSDTSPVFLLRWLIRSRCRKVFK